jgi:hypothetical protein
VREMPYFASKWQSAKYASFSSYLHEGCLIIHRHAYRHRNNSQSARWPVAYVPSCMMSLMAHAQMKQLLEQQCTLMHQQRALHVGSVHTILHLSLV